VHVDEPHGRRWEVALEVLAAGTATIEMAGVRVWRDTHPPRADGSIHIDVCSTVVPSFLTQSAAEREVARARRIISQASEDPRFAKLLASHKVVWEFVHHYGYGGVSLASIDQEGALVWHDSSGHIRATE